MRAALFGTYNRGHSANRILLQAMQSLELDVVEIHEPLWERTRDKDSSYFSPLGLIRLAFGWTRAAVRLARAWRRSGGAPLVVCGFNGQLDVLLFRLLEGRRSRLVFAPLVSITETLIDDRGVYSPRSWVAGGLRLLDRASFALADVVVADTHEHRQYLVELGADPSKVVVCHLGVDAKAFPFASAAAASNVEVDSSQTSAPVEVLYFGQYLPLHGLDVVVDAVSRLSARKDLRFVFIGTGTERARIQREIEAARVDAEFIDWVEYADLGRRIAQADIVLGIFGASRKASMVVANKIYEAAAMGCSIVTADTPALREIFDPETEVEVCRAEGADLARAIEGLADNPQRRRSLGERARERIAARFSTDNLARSWALPLLGADAASRRGRSNRPRLGVAIVNFNDSPATLDCVRSVLTDHYPVSDIVVVDNGSSAADFHNLEVNFADRDDLRLLRLESNEGYSGGNNLALAELFAAGCDHVLVLNNDTVLGPDSLGALVDTAEEYPNSGPIGSLVARNVIRGPIASRGERYWRSLTWLPRSLFRVRRGRAFSYEVGGVQGCALLISRRLFERCGGFNEDFFAYYEEVDYCLRSRSTGMSPRVEPRAEIAHRGNRGFLSGMTPLSAYLKARNLWIVGFGSSGRAGRCLFCLGYFPLVAISAAGYLFRGKFTISQAMMRGMAAGLRGERGRPPERELTVSAYRGELG
jgi:GT2 family glycosyltransferase/glycosyltransferase involved in cell wall biosynthesis